MSLQHRGLRPSVRIAESDWIKPRLRGFGSGVAGIVPDGFAAYARILHPASNGSDNTNVRWAQVAAWSGRQMHRLVQFHRIVEPSSSGVGSMPPNLQHPKCGDLQPHLLSALCTTLKAHTATTGLCWFCLWDGYGGLHGGSSRTVNFSKTDGSCANQQRTPRLADRIPDELRRRSNSVPEIDRTHHVRLPKRNYLLFEGALSAATGFGWIISQDTVFSAVAESLLAARP